MVETTGVLPQSNALAEASPDSLTELLSRDPEGYSKLDRSRIVAALREQRVRWQESEAAGRPRAARGSKAVEVSAATSDELGI